MFSFVYLDDCTYMLIQEAYFDKAVYYVNDLAFIFVPETWTWKFSPAHTAQGK